MAELNKEQICREALEHFGWPAQRLKFYEEIGELMVELARFDIGRSTEFSISEEIADVLILLEQLAIHYDCQEFVKDWTHAKLFNLKERIEHDKHS